LAFVVQSAHARETDLFFIDRRRRVTVILVQAVAAASDMLTKLKRPGARACLYVVALLLWLPAPAHAQADAASAAHSHFAAGEAHYREGKWSDALADFRAGYALDPRPEFLINIAQTERRLGQLDDALASCERFLARAPDSPLVGQVKQLMKELRTERAAARAEAAAAQGAALFADGQYERALDAYQRAYMDNIDEPRYLLSLAECYRALHRDADALRFYRLFLHERPGALERATVEARVRELAHPAPIAAPAPAATPPSVATPPLAVTSAPVETPPPRRPAWRRWWFWTAIGGTVAVGVGLGVGLGLRPTSNGNGSFMPTLPSFGPGGQTAALVVH
jgi:tetratricopeptide (TPR) repeat protein